uniref:LITAF domain-containing protein n=1 Tax=Elaeophora elaphi TaxID=1147741 RepID=A0A0R3S512_9BILA
MQYVSAVHPPGQFFPPLCRTCCKYPIRAKSSGFGSGGPLMGMFGG